VYITSIHCAPESKVDFTPDWYFGDLGIFVMH